VPGTERRLDVTFRHQRGHQSIHAGANEFAAFNRRADALATQASGPPGADARAPRERGRS